MLWSLQVLGVPSEDNWPGVSLLPNYKPGEVYSAHFLSLILGVFLVFNLVILDLRLFLCSDKFD